YVRATAGAREGSGSRRHDRRRATIHVTRPHLRRRQAVSSDGTAGARRSVAYRYADLVLTDPTAQLANDRARAREARDPWANLCVLSTVDGRGIAQSRILVLRDLDQRLAIFVNATSPKHAQI